PWPKRTTKRGRSPIKNDRTKEPKDFSRKNRSESQKCFEIDWTKVYSGKANSGEQCDEARFSIKGSRHQGSRRGRKPGRIRSAVRKAPRELTTNRLYGRAASRKNRS